jgi:hypothetical protein
MSSSLSVLPTIDAGDVLVRFVGYAQQMLDPATPESRRRQLEPGLQALLPTLQALGVFELFELRDPALRAWLADELAGLGSPARVGSR